MAHEDRQKGTELPIYRRPLREQLRASMHWMPAALLAVAVGFAVLSEFIVVGPNRTGSLPGAPILVIVRTGHAPARGDLVGFTPVGNRYYTEYPFWVKRLEGLPGDTVTYVGDTFFVNGKGVAKTNPRARDGRALTPGPTGILPECSYFVATDHPDGYDSRYADIGWVTCDQILGKAYALP